MGEEKLTKKRRPCYLIINKDFQLRFTLYYVVLTLFSVGFLWASIFFVFKVNIASLAEEIMLKEILQNIGNVTNYFFFWGSLLILALVVFLSLIMSRQIIGPLYRIEQDLKNFNSDQNEREIRIRKNDYFQSLVDELNDVFDKLKK